MVPQSAAVAALGMAVVVSDASVARMHDEHVAVHLLGDLLAHAMTHHPLGQPRLPRPDHHEIGLALFGEGHDRRGRIARYGDGLSLDAALGKNAVASASSA